MHGWMNHTSMNKKVRSTYYNRNGQILYNLRVEIICLKMSGKLKSVTTQVKRFNQIRYVKWISCERDVIQLDAEIRAVRMTRHPTRTHEL